MNLPKQVLTIVFYAAGYDPVQEILPSEQTQTVILYYAFVIYVVLTFLYCKLFEKRSIKSLGFGKALPDYLAGAGIAALLLIVTIVACMITGSIEFLEVNKKVDYAYIFALFGGLIVQGAAEGILCFEVTKESIINGGSYGIESSICTTIVLGMLVFILVKTYGKKECNVNGI